MTVIHASILLQYQKVLTAHMSPYGARMRAWMLLGKLQDLETQLFSKGKL